MGVLWAVTRAGWREVSKEKNDKVERTDESKAIEHSLHDTSSEGRAAELTHVARNRDTASDNRVIVDYHIYPAINRVRASYGTHRSDTHSSSFCTLFSIASAGLPKTAFHTLV